MRATHLFVAILVFVAYAAGGIPLRADEPRSESEELAVVAQLLRISEGSVVANVGAGGGRWAIRLAGLVGAEGKVYATEITALQVEGVRDAAQARGVANLEAVLGSDSETGLPDGCCAAMLLRLATHALDRPELLAPSLHRALAPGGRLLVIDVRQPAEELTAMLVAAGFEPLESIAPWQGRTGVYALLFQTGPAEQSVP